MSKQSIEARRAELAALIEGRSDEEITRGVEERGVESVLDGVFQGMADAFLPDKAAGQSAIVQYDVTVAFQDYDCLDGGVAVDKSLARGGAYALRVRGTSMTHVGIEPGDVVIVRPQNWADDGDFVVANYTDGDAGGSEGLATDRKSVV